MLEKIFPVQVSLEGEIIAIVSKWDSSWLRMCQSATTFETTKDIFEMKRVYSGKDWATARQLGSTLH